ncbi:hypothetical protein T4B_12812 [Trichinella pseudospiralis]|uniref:Uncharacterized protein n=1 Tax=Trichinella pseudospiralis TaxID=6337 RepID=A0A0V1GFA5_TRIPS|nr:hypothetical protein T4B_12812 [Trichinella pseudospiralis]
MQPGKSGVVSLYFSNCSESIDTHYVHISKVIEQLWNYCSPKFA